MSHENVSGKYSIDQVNLAEERLEEIRLDSMDKRLQGHNGRLEKLEEKMGKLEMRSKEDNGWLGRQENRIERVEVEGKTAMEVHGDRLAWLEGVAKGGDERLTLVGKRVGELEGKMRGLVNEVHLLNVERTGAYQDEEKEDHWNNDEDDVDDELSTTPRLEKIQLHMNIMARNIEAMGKRMEEIYEYNKVNFDVMESVLSTTQSDIRVLDLRSENNKASLLDIKTSGEESFEIVYKGMEDQTLLLKEMVAFLIHGKSYEEQCAAMEDLVDKDLLPKGEEL